MNEHREALMQMIFGFFPAQVLQVGVRLGLADELAAGKLSSADLARITGTHEPSLSRLLRALTHLGVLTEPEPGTYELTQRGELLRADVPGSVRNLTMLFCGHEVWRSWGELEHSVRTGQPSWEQLFGPPFEYLPAHPELNAIFNEAMAESTRMAAPGVIATCDFSRFRTVVDVGGGNGTLLAAILAATPGLHGVLFDTSSGLEEAPDVLGAAGLQAHCELVAGDFFRAVPDGADAYLLKSIIHDWDDERSVAILAVCRDAMGSDGTLLLVEPIMPARFEASAEGPFMVMSDLNMLVCTGGRERTKDEFRALLDAAGFELRSVTACPGATFYSVLEAQPRAQQLPS